MCRKKKGQFMKIKMAVLSCLVCAVVLAMCYEAGMAKAEPKTDRPSLKVGVISVRKIFQDCKRIVKYREESIAERNRIEAELDKLAKEIEDESTGLKKLKTNSSDYSTQMKAILTKQANSQAQQKFYEQQLALKEQQVIENLYRDILREARVVAEQKGLDLVLEKSEPDLPAPNSSDLMLTISTNKVLYSSGCSEITDEVMARIDAKD